MDTALQFGGGKDSLACLYLLRNRWDSMYVCWMNTGAAFPETVELMERVRRQVPHFVEICADVFADIEIAGWPVDVLPVNHTYMGQKFTGVDGILLRPYSECCAHNIWWPMHRKMVELGVKRIIRGQRLSEHYKSTVRDGDVVDGFTYHFPLQDWSEAKVFEFLRSEGVEIPDYYRYTGTSLDCWHCTAYLDAKLGQLAYMRERHPDKHAIVRARLAEIAVVTERSLEPLRSACA